jgi:hypothetical protein
MMMTTEPNDQNDKAPRVDVIALTISDPFGSPHLPITRDQAHRSGSGALDISDLIRIAAQRKKLYPSRQ